jgi:S-adenosylmethionine decarboxylase
MSQLITEVLVEAYGCEGPLNDGPALCAILREAARAVSATVVREATHAYSPHGTTAMIFLAESHLLITTWPEHAYSVTEMFLCNERMDSAACWRAIELELRPRETRFHRVPLRIGPK